MNIIQGLSLEGFQLEVAQNFSSIPGLMSYHNSLFRKQLDVSSNVVNWGDISSQNNNLFNNTATQRPIFANPYIESGQNKNLRSPRRDFNFLHNGSAFAVYSILKVDLSQAPNAFSILETSNGNFTGISFIANSANNGRVVLTVRNGITVVRQILMINILNTHPSESLVIIRHVFKGEGVSNNHILSYGNVQSIITNLATGYSSGNHNTFITTSNPNVSALKSGALLIYNWSGYSNIQIDSFDNEVLSLVTLLRTELDSLD